MGHARRMDRDGGTALQRNHRIRRRNPGHPVAIGQRRVLLFAFFGRARVRGEEADRPEVGLYPALHVRCYLLCETKNLDGPQVSPNSVLSQAWVVNICYKYMMCCDMTLLKMSSRNLKSTLWGPTSRALE